MKSIVKVIDVNTITELFNCPIEEIERAYEYAQKMESMGLEVEVDSPSITRTLANSLGVENNRLRVYEDSVEQEMHDHDCSSCAKDLDHSKE